MQMDYDPLANDGSGIQRTPTSQSHDGSWRDNDKSWLWGHEGEAEYVGIMGVVLHVYSVLGKYDEGDDISEDDLCS